MRAATRRVGPRLAGAALFAMIGVGSAAVANAQNSFATMGARTVPHMTPAVSAYARYIHRPVQIYEEQGSSHLYDDVAYQLNLDAALIFGLWNRLELALFFPLTVSQGSGVRPGGGAGYPEAPAVGAGIGDMLVLTKVHALTAGMMKLAVSAGFVLPTGNPTNYTGGGLFGFDPALIVTIGTERFEVMLNGGVRLRFRTESHRSAVHHRRGLRVAGAALHLARLAQRDGRRLHRRGDQS